MSGAASDRWEPEAFPAGFHPTKRRHPEPTDWEELESPDGEPVWVTEQPVPAAGRAERLDGGGPDEAPVAVPAEVALLPLSGATVRRGGRDRSDPRARAAAALPRPARVAVLGARGGGGRTTVTALLALTLAALRSGPVSAVDAVPDFGALAARLAAVGALQGRRPDVREAAEPGLAGGIEALLGLDGLVIVDPPAGARPEPLPTVIDAADLLVLVVAPDRWSAHPDLRLLDWLDVNGRDRLVRTAVAVLNEHSAGGADLDPVAAHLAQRCRSVVRLAHEPHLADGGPIVETRLQEPFVGTCLELAAAVVDALANGSWADPATEELVEEIQLAAATISGYLGARVQQPGPARTAWRVTLAFAAQEDLDAWRASAARARCFGAVLSPPAR
jgi:MinD-like ATPase involved in chromosome partitioning or flagellar assembly